MHGQHFEGKQTGNSLHVSTGDREKCFHLHRDALVVTRRSFGASRLFDSTANKRHSAQCKPGQELNATPQRPLQRPRTESTTGRLYCSCFTIICWVEILRCNSRTAEDLQGDGLFWFCRPAARCQNTVTTSGKMTFYTKKHYNYDCIKAILSFLV